MKSFVYTFGDVPSIRLIPLSDFHIGGKLARMDLINDLVNYVMSQPDLYVVVNGDLVEMYLGGGGYQTTPPGEQISKAVEILRPLAATGKILCMMDGNHEYRFSSAVGVSVASAVAAQLGIPGVATEDAALLFLEVGHITYSVYVTHGSNTCKETGGKINKLAQLADIIDTDVYISGHTHVPAVFRSGFIRIDRNRDTFEKVEHLFVNSASVLGYGDYAENGCMRVCSNVYPIITLDGNTRNMRVCV